MSDKIECWCGRVFTGDHCDYCGRPVGRLGKAWDKGAEAFHNGDDPDDPPYNIQAYINAYWAGWQYEFEAWEHQAEW